MKTKSIDCKAIDVDIAKRQVVVYFSKFGNIDYADDMIMPGSYTKTINEQGRKGADLIWHLADHRSALTHCLSKPELEQDSFGLKGVSAIVDTTIGLDALKLYDAGFVNQHSVGYRVMKESRKTQGTREYNEITEIKLFEGSTVLWGCNPDTPTVEVKSLADMEEQMEIIEKQFKSGTLSDDTFIVLQKYHAHLGELLKKHKKSTQPDLSTEPDYAAFAERLKSKFILN